MERSSRDVVANCGPVVDELAAGSLGDDRLNDRRNRVLAVLERQPDSGFPEACGDDAEVEALYRFLRNRRVSLAGILAPHLDATASRCAAIGDVLVVHDTTDLVFTGAAPRAGLTRLSPGRQGFWLHAALAVSADGLRAPLGLLAAQPFVRPPPARGTKKDDHKRFADPAKESRCWGQGVADVRRRCGVGPRVLHVMDRAGDSYELFSDMVADHDRFIVRVAHDRRVVTADGRTVTMRAAVPPTEASAERPAVLAARRDGHRTLSSRTLYPARESRIATLRMAARRIEVPRPAHVPPHHPASLTVNLVAVWEVDPPAGQAPVVWHLLTTEPIDTRDDIVHIVDAYRTRWLIEEFFKALKTGCAYEKRQLESYQTLLVALALLAPIAWRLLLLRHLARAVPATAATVALSARQLQVLRASPTGAALSQVPTIGEALLVVARLGGHLRQNGPPGWLVIARGLHKLLTMEIGWRAAQRIRDQM